MLAKLECRLPQYPGIFSKKWQNQRKLVKYSTKILFDNGFDCQGTLLPSKIFKSISKISTLNY
jgi:hypothetical protein